MGIRKMKTKLYIIENSTRKKIYLDVKAVNRPALAKKIGSNFFQIMGNKYSVNQVLAEEEKNDPFVGTVVGGIIGTVFGGPFGVLGGAVLGGLIASGSNDSIASTYVDEFNNSEVTHLPR
ncbi:MAG: hypothetical protein WBO44_05225 [Saprospiraceae bacterium]